MYPLLLLELSSWSIKENIGVVFQPPTLGYYWKIPWVSLLPLSFRIFRSYAKRVVIRTKTLNWGKIESSFVDKSVRQRQPLAATRWPPCQGNPEKKRRERRSRKQIAASHLYCSTRISALDRTKENPFPSLLWMHVYYRFRHKNGRFMRKSGYWIFQYISAWKWHGITATTTFYYKIQKPED